VSSAKNARAHTDRQTHARTHARTGLAEKAELKAVAAQTSPAVQRAAQHLQQDGVDDSMMLSKKLRETQRLLLEAYAESDMLRAEVVRAMFFNVCWYRWACRR
jgi:IS5 family transposase